MKKLIASILTIAMIMSSISVFAKDYSNYPQKFWDVPKNSWMFEPISELADRGVINGYEDGSFRPDDTVNRGEWAKMMVTIAGLQTNDNNIYFNDMNNHWANRYVNAAKEYLTTYKDGSFKPDQAAVREDVAVSIVKLKGYDVNNVDYSILNNYKDSDSISNNLKKYMAVAIEKMIMVGYQEDMLGAQFTLTRAEAATMLQRAFQYGNDNKVVDNKETDNSSSVNDSGVSNSIATPTPTPKPTEKPVATPEPTKKPEPAKESEEVKTPEPTPEPEPIKKPYKVETLAKVNVTSLRTNNPGQLFYTQGKDDLYYFDNDTHDIVKINMISRNKEIVNNSDTLTVEYDGNEYSNMTVRGIFYDSYVNSICVYGSFENGENLFEQKADTFDCIVDLNTMNVATFKDIYMGSRGDTPVYHSIGDYNFCGILNNGDYIAYSNSSYIVMNRNSFNDWYYLGVKYSNFGIPFQEYNGEIYHIGTNHNGLYQLEQEEWSGSDKRISELPFWGLVNNKGYVLTSTTTNDYAIIIHKITGEFIKDIVFADIEIMDKNRVIPNNINQVLLASTNDDIVFYDTWMKAFRIISENE